MLCDLVFAKNAAVVVGATAPAQDLGGLDVKGIESVKLTKLYALVAKKTPAQLKAAFPMVDSAGDEGPWVLSVPADFVDAVAALSAGEQKKIAAEWAKGEEFEKDGFKPAGVAKALTSIVGLCQAAKKKKLPVVLWMSL